MTAIVYIALCGWPLIALALASWLRAPRSVVVSCIVAWLFLPQFSHDFPGPLDLSKVTSTTISLLLGLAIFEPRRLGAFRPAWVDLPIAVFILAAIGSSVTNGLGVYDGLSEATIKAFTWGLPWLVGRVCFRSVDDLRVLILGVILGGLAYLPLCLYEVRMSPQLHRMVYGFFPHDFGQTHRDGAFRPTVFMQHGLMVGMWMCMSALAGGWMLQAGRLRSLLGVPMWAIVPAQVAAAYLCKSVGAIALGLAGWAIMTASHLMRIRLVLLALAVIPIMYIGYRAADGPTAPFVDAVRSMPMLSGRVASFEYRLNADNTLLDHAREKTLFGWGGHGRHRPLNEEGEELTRTDSLWVITLGQNGVVGAASLYAVLCLPLLVAASRVPAKTLFAAGGAPLLALATITGLYACDSLFNAMYNPIYIMAGGGVISTVATLRRAPARTGVPRAAARGRLARGRGAEGLVPAGADTGFIAASSSAAHAAQRPGLQPLLPARDVPEGALSPVVAHLRPLPEPEVLERDESSASHPRLAQVDEPVFAEPPPQTEPPSPHPFPAPPPEPPDRLSIPWRAPRS